MQNSEVDLSKYVNNQISKALTRVVYCEK